MPPNTPLPVVKTPCTVAGFAQEAELLLQGRRYRVVCVDGVPPRQLVRAGSARPVFQYHGRELAHFALGDSRYALVPAEVPAPQSPPAAGRDPRALLTGREMQIVQLICLGLLTKQVADRLHLSEFTVRSYMKTIYCKLGVRSRGGMVYAFAQAFGLSASAVPALEPD